MNLGEAELLQFIYTLPVGVVEMTFDGRVELLNPEAMRLLVQMPLMDGLQATAALRQHERTSSGHLQVVAMTAHAMVGDRERCVASGMDGYLSKPLVLGELDAVLASVA